MDGWMISEADAELAAVPAAVPLDGVALPAVACWAPRAVGHRRLLGAGGGQSGQTYQSTTRTPPLPGRWATPRSDRLISGGR